MLRGSGYLWDLRKEFGYDGYNFINFLVPYGLIGDCYDRYLIRIEEMKQSILIISICLQKICIGPIKIFDNKVINVSRTFLKNSMEALIAHFKFYSESFSIEKSDVYVTVEAPKGEFGIYLCADGTNKPYRCHIKAPGFLHIHSIDFMTKNHYIADVVTIIGTQDIVFGEVDR